jgi:hypothetical protein
LEEYQKISTNNNMSKREYFKKGSAYHQDPTLKGARYCRCVLHVADAQPRWCLRHKAWRKVRGKKTCYNPYAVCTARLKRKGVMHCGDAYNVSGFPKSEQKTYVLLQAPKPKTRSSVKKERKRKTTTLKAVPRVKIVTRKQLLERAKKARLRQPDKFKGYYRWRKAQLCKALNVKC